MNEQERDERKQQPLPQAGSAPVPVYDCHVIVSPPDEQGMITARASSLEGITGKGASEREALLQVVAAFKARIQKHAETGEPIPWLKSPHQPQPGEAERWIPVHL